MNKEILKKKLQTNFVQVIENAKDLFFVTSENYLCSYSKEERTRHTTHRPTTQQALSMLKAVGVSRAEIHFYGGHDSGDVDEINIEVDRDNFTHSFAYSELFSDLDIGYVKTKDELPDHNFGKKDIRFEEALVDPIWSKYGSFAGDYSVDGYLKYDCVNGTVLLTGEESTWQSIGEVNCLDDEYDANGMREFSKGIVDLLRTQEE
ncbi:hypothetical protein N9E35_01485 [Candidatus Marinimicrobia bacterium]|nr:hypothetical protein [Candidatus Neomarinimicrobiota bacterium]